MKQAILITAYHNIENLNRLINLFNEDFNFYIHIDLKSHITLSTTNHNIHVYSKFNINWGGIRHVDAILFLCKQALIEEENKIFHLISGDDYPILSQELFNRFFRDHKNISFLDYFKLPSENWSGNGGMDRIKYYHPLDRLNIKKAYDYNVYMRYLSLQKHKGIARNILNIDLYGGSTWWSLNRECVDYIIKNKNKYNLYNRLNDTFVPEEIYIPTLLLNSPLASTIINNNLRYISWHFKHNNIPAILDEEDLFDISQTTSFFIRKIDPEISKYLISNINKNNLFYKGLVNNNNLLISLYQYLNQEYNNLTCNNLSNGKLGVLVSLFIFERLYTIKQKPRIQTYKRFIKILDECESYPLDLLFELGTALATIKNNNLCNINTENLFNQLDQIASNQIAKYNNIHFSLISYIHIRKLTCTYKYDISPYLDKIKDFKKRRMFDSKQISLKHYPYGILGFAGIMLILIEATHKELELDFLFFCHELINKRPHHLFST